MPITHPVVRPARVGEELVDDGFAVWIFLEGFDFFERRHDAEGVERDAAQEGQIIRQRREREVIGADVGPVRAFFDPFREQSDLVLG